MDASSVCTPLGVPLIQTPLIAGIIYLLELLRAESRGAPRTRKHELVKNIAAIVVMTSTWGMTGFSVYALSVCPGIPLRAPSAHEIAIAIFAFVLEWAYLQSAADRIIAHLFTYKVPLPKYVFIQQFYFSTREEADRFLVALQGRGVDVWTYPGLFSGKYLVEYGSRMDEGEAREIAEGLGLRISSIEYR